MKSNKRKARKRNYIFQYIRRSQLKRLPYSLILFCISLFFFIHYINSGPFHTVSLSSSSVDEETLLSNPYVSVTVSDLYYSGDDYMVNGRQRGYFYYTLESGTCQYFILKSTGEEPTDYIEQLSFYGKTIQSEDLSLQLLTNMASRLNLSQEQLSSITSPIIISQPDFLTLRDLLFLILLGFCILLCGISSLRMILCIFFPTQSKAYRGLKHYGIPRKILANVEKELEENCIIQTTDLALTNRYLIEFSEDMSAIVPLEAVIWAYKMGQIRRSFPSFRKNMRYTLNLVTIDGRHYSFHNKRKGDVVLIQEEMSRRYPNFFFGYSEEHEEMVNHIIKEWKAEHRR